MNASSSAAAVVILACALVAPAAARAASRSAQRPLSAPQQDYLSVVEQGFGQATSRWGNRRQHWYNALLHDRKPYPLATIWDVVPLFETADETALASPTSQSVNRVIQFADYAESYWDRNATPAPGVRRRTPAYAPYPGSWSDAETFFDDDGWWGLAFMDASDAMTESGRARLGARRRTAAMGSRSATRASCRTTGRAR